METRWELSFIHFRGRIVRRRIPFIWLLVNNTLFRGWRVFRVVISIDELREYHDVIRLGKVDPGQLRLSPQHEAQAMAGTLLSCMQDPLAAALKPFDVVSPPF